MAENDVASLTLLRTQVADLQQRLRSNQNGGGSGHDGDGVGPRLSKLEAHVDHMRSDLGAVRDDMRQLRTDIKDLRGEARTDFRLVFGAIIAVALGLASLFAKGFHWL